MIIKPGRGQQGFTFLELLIGTVVFLITLGAILTGLRVGLHIINASNLKISAMALLEARMEEIKNDDYADITTANYPDDYPTLDTRGTADSSDDITAKRTVSIASSGYKTVTAGISWNFQGQNYQEQISTIITEWITLMFG